MLQVKTNYGIVEGVLDETRRSVLYAGIPFAAPPVGELRWKAPQEPAAWEGVLSCKQFKAAAVQHLIPVPSPYYPCYGQEYFITAEDPMDEDCLYLNVWTPANVKQEDKLPVLFIIHGGGFTTGTGAIPVISGRNIARESVVVVTINYRLGMLGYFAHPELSAESSNGVSGNYGVMDQIAALKWVNENIAYFGGDPKNITIAGESAGAGSVSVLCASELTKGLFQKAVAQSGTCNTKTNLLGQGPKNLAEAEQRGVELMKKWDVSSVDELRKIPARELIKVRAVWGPFRDGYAWNEEGEVPVITNDVPILIGSNSDEGKTFYNPCATHESFEAELKARYGEYFELVRDAYLKNYPNISEAGYAEVRDRCFEFPMYYWAITHAKYGNAPAYLYYFDRAVPGQEFGAFHTSNLEYFYQNLECTDAPWESVDRELSRTMTDYLVNFMRNGDPNGPGLPEWKDYANSPEMLMELGENIGMIPKPHKDEMAALMAVYK